MCGARTALENSRAASQPSPNPIGAATTEQDQRLTDSEPRRPPRPQTAQLRQRDLAAARLDRVAHHLKQHQPRQ